MLITTRAARKVWKSIYYHFASPEAVFDGIYRDGAWGVDMRGRPTSGSGSRTRSVVEPYVAAVTAFLAELDNPIVVDIGCGDFAVGRHLLPYTGGYVACDISTVILEQNAREYRDPKLAFSKLNLATDDLPRGDVGIVRQVLQHLGNKDIAAFVARLHRTRPYKFLIVTEHLPKETGFPPNLDKVAGPHIRVPSGSGVDLTQAPFSLECLHSRVLLSVDKATGGAPARIVTTLYEF